MKIGIAHRTIVSHDAIGTDILGMYETLIESGFDVCLIGEYFDRKTKERARTAPLDQAIAADDKDILIYHHSIEWPGGERLLGKTRGARLMKYHNVTPPKYFRHDSRVYVAMCAQGRAQTGRLIALMGEHGRLTADSHYNASELITEGASEVDVVPPFTHVETFIRRPASMPTPPFKALFVGRVSPNKGHLDLVSVIAAYVARFGPGINLTIVGGLDDQLMNYTNRVRREIDRLGVSAHVKIVPQVNDDALRTLFDEADIYLCMSEHEGFCVPIIEAQAAAIPIVSTNVTAIAETIGPGQLAVGAPRTRTDYLHIAHLIHAACTDRALRRQLIVMGQRNVLTRFTSAKVADLFMASLAPVLDRLARTPKLAQ